MDAETLERLAELIVGLGANVQPGQVVGVSSEIGKETLTRAVAEAAYRRGARYVDVVYWDPWVRRARSLHAAEETLDYVPSWLGSRMLAMGELHSANIALVGPVAPEIFDDCDPRRLGRDRLPRIKESLQVMNDRTTNWLVAPAPTVDWARVVFPQLEPDAALARLEEQVLYVLRMDEADPVAAWRARAAEITGVAARLSERRFDAIRLAGPGTDLTVGLLPSGRWLGAQEETVDGVGFIANLPTEEVFTSPDPERVDGHVTATKPLVVAGSVIDGIRVRFEGGRAVEVDADRNADILRGRVTADDGAARLGELALVDGSGRIGPLGTVFYETLLDENAASHIALGTGFDAAVGPEDVARVNKSAIHIDFMIGGPEVDVTGITREGEHVSVLRSGVWQI